MALEKHRQVLKQIVNGLEGKETDWVLTGSLGLALQGLPVAVDDIDIQTDADGAYEFERCFAADVLKPVQYSEVERIRSHYGKFMIDGMRVEVMGDVQKRLEDGSWEASVVLADHKHWIEIDRMRVPVLRLEYELVAYSRLGRKEKVEAIRAWLEKNKP